MPSIDHLPLSTPKDLSLIWKSLICRIQTAMEKSNMREEKKRGEIKAEEKQKRRKEKKRKKVTNWELKM